MARRVVVTPSTRIFQSFSSSSPSPIALFSSSFAFASTSNSYMSSSSSSSARTPPVPHSRLYFSYPARPAFFSTAAISTPPAPASASAFVPTYVYNEKLAVGENKPALSGKVAFVVIKDVRVVVDGDLAAKYPRILDVLAQRLPKEDLTREEKVALSVSQYGRKNYQLKSTLKVRSVGSAACTHRRILLLALDPNYAFPAFSNLFIQLIFLGV